MKNNRLGSLARLLEIRVATWIDSDGNWPSIQVIQCVAEVRELIDEFPDEEVDDVLVKELRKRIPNNGDRIAEVNRVLRGNELFLLSRESWYRALV